MDECSSLFQCRERILVSRGTRESDLLDRHWNGGSNGDCLVNQGSLLPTTTGNFSTPYLLCSNRKFQQRVGPRGNVRPCVGGTLDFQLNDEQLQLKKSVREF